ncbi:hypothetical protein [Nakamurella sp. PAMC28650]|uniref:hypothetical protein n=1 Tax=Nakamurella sp. PAMC28650 TaxID=2762325 RepID=UPI00164D33C1|nr:hypothetical protein [Nakamurella sp. PAMC28650]QNK80418.1 hypothetical protein H7F38_19885 [Nakamurella sp. PAMC28650]
MGAAGPLMARPCSVCSHPDLAAIDRALVNGDPYREIAKRDPPVSVSAIQRHRVDHLSPSLRVLSAVAEHESGRSLLEQLSNLNDRVLKILDDAATTSKPSIALAAIREARALIQLSARLTGELDERPQTMVINLASTNEWTEARTAIVRALQPFPDARNAVMRALGGGEIDVIESA